MSTPLPIPFERGSSDLREAILREATRQFAEKGFAGTTMREVAEAARCTKPALYYHFENKEALFLAVIRSRTDAISAILHAAFTAPRSVRERLEGAAQAYFDYVRREPTAIKVLWRSEMHVQHGQPSFDWVSVRKRYWEQLRLLLEEGVASGELGAEIDLDDALHALVGIVDIRCRLWVLQGEPIPEDAAQRALTLLFGGLSP